VRCIGLLADAAGDALLDVHTDADHHRSVFTLASTDAPKLDASVRAFAARVAELVRLEGHAGAHPRFGALDVMPFVSLAGTDDERQEAVATARDFGEWWATTFDVPVFFYDDASPGGCALPDVRREAFRSRPPDIGPAEPHPSLGATAVAARRPLIAVNCVLETADVAVARRIAGRVRERDGGLPGVRALGLWLPTPGQAQVSMNLVDLDRTGLEGACTQVQAYAREEGIDIVHVELVGLMPASELERCGANFLRWSGLDSSCTIESRLRRRAGGG
jgi:glutamate formiminotransferase / 5-formyltetrahydrofolate cyclo-ligase